MTPAPERSRPAHVLCSGTYRPCRVVVVRGDEVRVRYRVGRQNREEWVQAWRVKDDTQARTGEEG